MSIRKLRAANLALLFESELADGFLGSCWGRVGVEAMVVLTDRMSPRNKRDVKVLRVVGINLWLASHWCCRFGKENWDKRGSCPVELRLQLLFKQEACLWVNLRPVL